MQESPKYNADDKLHWEAKKLEAEFDEMSRHFARKPTFWLSAVPAVVAVVGIGLQYYASSLDYKKADIMREKANLDTAQLKQEVNLLEKELRSLEQEVTRKQNELTELLDVTRKLEKAREERNKEIAAVSSAVDRLRKQKGD